MKPNHILFLISISFLFLATPCYSQIKPTVEQQHIDTLAIKSDATDTIANYPSLLWKITAKKDPKPSYLYGTMHTNDSATHHLATLVLEELESCEVVATEIVLEESGLGFDIFGLLSSMLMKDTTLQDLYSEKEYQLVQQFLKDRLGLIYAVVNLDKCKPIFLSTLVGDMDPTKMEQSDKPIVDFYFQEQGKSMGKRLVGIETMEEQLSALDKIPLKKQAEMLLAQVQGIGEQDSLATTLTELYVAQDLDGLWALYLTQAGGDSPLMEEFDQAVVTERNEVMAERIDSLIQLQPTFVGVGALHLPSEKGVIELLRKRGYQVEAVRFGR